MHGSFRIIGKRATNVALRDGERAWVGLCTENDRWSDDFPVYVGGRGEMEAFAKKLGDFFCFTFRRERLMGLGIDGGFCVFIRGD